jgi:hypothetical protein
LAVEQVVESDVVLDGHGPTEEPEDAGQVDYLLTTVVESHSRRCNECHARCAGIPEGDEVVILNLRLDHGRAVVVGLVGDQILAFIEVFGVGVNLDEPQPERVRVGLRIDRYLEHLHFSGHYAPFPASLAAESASRRK